MINPLLTLIAELLAIVIACVSITFIMTAIFESGKDWRDDDDEDGPHTGGHTFI